MSSRKTVSKYPIRPMSSDGVVLTGFDIDLRQTARMDQEVVPSREPEAMFLGAKISTRDLQTNSARASVFDKMFEVDATPA